MRSYANNLAVSYSILVNAILGGMRYEMLSSRVHRCGWTVTALVIDWWFWLIFGEIAHCLNCYEWQRQQGIYDLPRLSSDD